MINKFSELPKRIQGEGSRADFYTLIDKSSKIALLEDDEFERVVDHNAKRSFGENDNAILISNMEDDCSYLVIRKSALSN